MTTGSKDKESLMGLFSTRASNARLLDTPANTPATKPSATSTVTRTTSGTVAATGTMNGTQTRSTATGVGGTRSQLSPLASTVLREARRELGSDYNLQQAQAAGQAIGEASIALAVDKVLKKRNETLDDIERANVIIHLQKDLMGWGVLQPLVDNREVTDIHVYDYQTVVLQRGKQSETTGLHWPNHQAYVAFIDRLLMRLGSGAG